MKDEKFIRLLEKRFSPDEIIHGINEDGIDTYDLKFSRPREPSVLKLMINKNYQDIHFDSRDLQRWFSLGTRDNSLLITMTDTSSIKEILDSNALRESYQSELNRRSMRDGFRGL